MSDPNAPGPTATHSPPPTQHRLLRRGSTERWMGGVGTGFGRYLGIDPVLVRVGLIVLTIIAGLPIIGLYIACLFVIPSDDAPDAYDEHLVDRRGRLLAILAGIVVVLSVVGNLDHGPGVWHEPWALLIGLGVLGVVWLVRRQDGASTGGFGGPGGTGFGGPFGGPPVDPDARPADTPLAHVPAAATTQGQTDWRTVPPTTEPLSPVPPTPYPAAAYSAYTAAYTDAYTEAYTKAASKAFTEPDPRWKPRERSALGPLTVGAALVTAGSLVALDQADVVSVPAVVVLASTLVVVGLGLLVGAFVGRSRGLIALGVVLSIVTAIASVVHLPANNSIGEQTWAPRTVTEVEATYAWGIGSTQLDLSAISSPTPVSTAVDLGVGELLVIVPRGAVVRLHAEVGAGEIVTTDINGNHTTVDGINREVTTTLTPPLPVPGATTFDLDLSAGIGSLEVTRA